MNKRELFKKAIAWSLIVTMVNPAMIAPAFARDSDIYLASTTGTSTAEPNVLFILGTNDRMNAAEGWREYDPVTYDSHAEYLWNDTNVISTAEVLAEHINKISDAAPPVNPFSPWGTWSGADPLTRKNLWLATLAYAQGVQGSDPGPRSTYRNYYDGSWFYWLPTGTATTDPRLWSRSFNRFRGHVQFVTNPPSRGGVTYPTPIASGALPPYDAANDFTQYNLCSNSLSQIVPSTIFAPSNQPANAGYMTNQQWVRYEPYLNLTRINNVNGAIQYPGPHNTSNVIANTSSSPTVTTFFRGYVDGTTGSPTNTTAIPPTDVYRDSFGPNTSSQPIGQQGQPIRIQKDITPVGAVDAGDSYAGWTDPAADMGGYTFTNAVIGGCDVATVGTVTATLGMSVLKVASTAGFAAGNAITIAGAGPGGTPWNTSISSVVAGTNTINLNNSAITAVNGASVSLTACTTATVLQNLRTTAYSGAYTQIPAVAAPSATAGQIEQFSAWQGNRDTSVPASPAWGSVITGTPAYYDISGGAPASTTVSGTANSVGKFRLTVASSVNLPTGTTVTVSGMLGAGAVNANGNWTITNIDATHIDLVGSVYAAGYTGGSGVVFWNRPDCDPTNGPALANQCIQFSGGANTYQITQNCAPTGTVNYEVDANNGTRFTLPGGTCTASGGASCFVNGVLQGSLAPCTGAPANMTAASYACALQTNNTFATTQITTNCSYGGFTTDTVNTCTWTNRQSVLIEGAGAGTYYYGGTCGENGGGAMYNAGQANSACAIGGGGLAPGVYSPTLTLNTVSQTDVIGPYPSPTPANGLTTLGCYNTRAAGAYKYNGTCSGGVVYQMPTFPGAGASCPGGNCPATLPAPPVPNPKTTAALATAAAARQFIGSAPNPLGARTALCAAPSAFTNATIRGNPNRNYNPTCNNNYSNVGTCAAWYGTACLTSSAAGTYCPNMAPSVAAGATAKYYQAYLTQGFQNYLYHECLADIGNPSNSYPTAQVRTFAANANATLATMTTGNAIQANTTYAGGTNLQRAAPYDTTAGNGVVADSSKNIDVYSVNYLNFLYGAKACRDSTGALITTSPVSAPPAGATCSPIARKTRLAVAKDALSQLIQTTDAVRLGLMVFNKTDTTLVNDGGNIQYAIHRMGVAGLTPADPDVTNRTNLINKIQAVVASSRTPLTETMYEAYRYFSGRTPKWGTSATGALGGGTVSAGYDTTVGANVDPLPGNSAVVNLINGGVYNSPMLNNPNVATPANCQKNYVVMITNGQAEDDAAANADIKTMAWASPGGTTLAPRTDFDTAGAFPNNAGAPDYHQIPTVVGFPPYGPTDLAGAASDGGYIWLDELTYFMSQADVSPGAADFQSEYTNCGAPSGTHVCNTPIANPYDTQGPPASNPPGIDGRQSIITYTIGFAGVNAAVVQHAAEVSGGVYYVAQNAQQLQAALQAAFIAIRNWNPTAAAATVPISSLNRGESSTDVYLAFFGPTVASTWSGTVKKYQISNSATDCGVNIPLCLIGQNAINGLYNIETIDAVTGQSVVDPTATSGPNDLHHPPLTAWYPNTVRDGALPTKGGTGQVLIDGLGAPTTPDQRNIYTYLTDSVTLYTGATLSTTTDLTDVTNAVDYATNGNNVTRCRLGDSGACNGSPTMGLNTKETLLSFIRGGNTGDTNCNDGSTGTLCQTWGTWPHASVEHSKPVVVTYDSTVTPPVQYMFYVQNNGMLTAVDTNTGKEVWSFLIEEALPKISLMQANLNGPELYVADGNPVVFFDDHNGDGKVQVPTDRVWIYFGLRRGGRVFYALDISNKLVPKFKWKITAEQPSLTDGAMTAGNNRIFVGYSANFTVGQDVTVAGAGPGGADLTATITSITAGQTHIHLSANASTTVANALVTSVGSPISGAVCNAASSCVATAKYTELGQTWSTPAIVNLKTLFGVVNNPPALIFGGGYDPAEDTIPPGTRTMGRAVFVVNGDTGAIVKSFGAGQGNVAGDYRTGFMLNTYAVPSDITAINTDFDALGYVDRLVFGDLGGNVWRFDVDDPDVTLWKGVQLASLSNGVGEKRKFFFAPAVAPQNTPFRFDGVYLGSGDKEHPLLTQLTTPAVADDKMFMIMDDPSLTSGGGTPGAGGPSAMATPVTYGGGNLVNVDAYAAAQAALPVAQQTPLDLTGFQGWYKPLDTGEKVINAATVFKLSSTVSHLRFGTYAPVAHISPCTPPGEGRLNEMNSIDGTLLLTNASTGAPSRWYTGFLSRGYISSTQLLVLPGSGTGSTKVIYQFNCADANCQGNQIGTLGAPTKIYWYLEPEQ